MQDCKVGKFKCFEFKKIASYIITYYYIKYKLVTKIKFNANCVSELYSFLLFANISGCLKIGPKNDY